MVAPPAAGNASRLILIEIVIDPISPSWRDREELAGSGDLGANLSSAVANVTIDRGTDFGVAEVERGDVHIRASLRDRRLGFRDLDRENGPELPRRL